MLWGMMTAPRMATAGCTADLVSLGSSTPEQCSTTASPALLRGRLCVHRVRCNVQTVAKHTAGHACWLTDCVGIRR